MNVLAITNLYPNNIQPDRGVFNRQQFERLSRLCELSVIAPVPWAAKMFGRRDQKIFPRDVVEQETINGIDVYHPRHFVTPKTGRRFYGRWMYKGIKNLVREIHQRKPFDVIFAAWAYPDAYAAMLIGREFNKPYCVQVHGSDINIFTASPSRRKLITETLQQSCAVVAVSSALADKVKSLGVESGKVHLVFSGINKTLFFKKDKSASKKTLGLSPSLKHIVFIGNLVAVKGVIFLIEAMRQLPEDVHLHILGDGELRDSLMNKANTLGLNKRITFEGRKPHGEISGWMNAADIFCLPSLNEGSPNVILESLACGTPVVASRVGGIPELLINEDLGLMAAPANADELAACLKKALEKLWNHQAIAEYALRFDWDDNAKHIHQLLSGACHENR